MKCFVMIRGKEPTVSDFHSLSSKVKDQLKEKFIEMEEVEGIVFLFTEDLPQEMIDSLRKIGFEDVESQEMTS